MAVGNDELNDFLTDIYKEYNEELLKTALRRVGNEADAMDIIGQLFYIASLKKQEFFYHPNKIGWLYKAIDFCILKHNVRNASKKIQINDEGKKIVEYTQNTFVPLEEYSDKIFEEVFFYEGDLFERYKDILTEEELKYIIYKFEFEFDNKEIAKRLNKTYTATTSFGSRIKNKIFKFIKKS